MSAFLYMAAAGLLLLLVSAKLALAPAPAPAPAPANALRGALGAAGGYGMSAGLGFPHLTLPALARAPAGAAAPAAAAPGERTAAQRGGETSGDGSAGAGGDAHAGLGLQHGHHRHRRHHHKQHVPAGGGAPGSDEERAGAWCVLTHKHTQPALPCFAPRPTPENSAALRGRLALVRTCACGLHSRGHVPIGETCKYVHLYQTLSVSPRAHTDHRRDVRWM